MKVRACRWWMGFGLVVLSIAYAGAAQWPERPVRVVVPFAPGGGTDVVARLVAPRLTEELGQQFVIDNRAGAGGTIGTEIVARASPDGYTINIGASSYASSAALYKLSYDPMSGMSFVTLITRGPFVLAVHPSLPAKDIREFIALAKAKPGALSFGSSGTGGVPHLATEHLRQMTNTDMVHVPYKGDAPAILDLLAGRIQFYLGGPLVLSPHMSAGRVRGLAVTSEQRASIFPDLPAINEAVPGYSAFTWFGLWAPPKTPHTIVMKLHEAIQRTLKRPDVLERLRADGMEPGGNSPEAFARFVAADIAKWNKVVKAGNIRVD